MVFSQFFFFLTLHKIYLQDNAVAKGDLNGLNIVLIKVLQDSLGLTQRNAGPADIDRGVLRTLGHHKLEGGRMAFLPFTQSPGHLNLRGSNFSDFTGNVAAKKRVLETNLRLDDGRGPGPR